MPYSNPFTLYPQPHTGQGAFGLVPGPLGVPGPYGDIDPALVSGAVSSHLEGVLSPEEQAAIQDAGARFGVTSGMPGSGLARNRTVRDIGLATGQRQAQGLSEYNALVPGAAFKNEIASQNALNAAAPDPAQAASYAKSLFDQYLNSIRGAGRISPAGGTTPGASIFNLGGAPTNPAGGTVPTGVGPGWGELSDSLGNVWEGVSGGQGAFPGEYALPGDVGGQAALEGEYALPGDNDPFAFWNGFGDFTP